MCNVSGKSKQGQPARYDVEYERNGVAHLVLYYAPFDNWRRIEVTDNHAAGVWAEGVRRLGGLSARKTHYSGDG